MSDRSVTAYLANLLTSLSTPPPDTPFALERAALLVLVRTQVHPGRQLEYEARLREAVAAKAEIRRRDFEDPLTATAAMHVVRGEPVNWIDFTNWCRQVTSTAAQQSAPNDDYADVGDSLFRFHKETLLTIRTATRSLTRAEVHANLKRRLPRPPSLMDTTRILHSLWRKGLLEPVAVPGSYGRSQQGWSAPEPGPSIPDTPRAWVQWIWDQIRANGREISEADACARASALCGYEIVVYEQITKASAESKQGLRIMRDNGDIFYRTY